MTDSETTAGDNAAPDIAVAVVGAETPGNIGTIARAMKNFGLSELLLVDPPELDPDGEAYGFAGSAREDVLPNATELSFEDLVENYHTVACTATTNEDATSHVRYPAKTPRELLEHLRGVDGRTALVFGRERVGLTNDELAAFDEICSIPASAEYPVLNLGQSATILLYELRELTVERTQHPDELHERADPGAIERLHDQFDEYLDAIGHPGEKRAKTRRLFRRVAGRAHLTPREVRTMLGLFRRGTERSRAAEPRGDGSEFGGGTGNDGSEFGGGTGNDGSESRGSAGGNGGEPGGGTGSDTEEGDGR